MQPDSIIKIYYIYKILYIIYTLIIIVLWSQPAPSKTGTKEELDWLWQRRTSRNWRVLAQSLETQQMVVFRLSSCHVSRMLQKRSGASFWFWQPDLAADLCRGPACGDHLCKSSFGFTQPADEISVQSLHHPTSCERHFLWDVFRESRGCTQDSPGSLF